MNKLAIIIPYYKIGHFEDTIKSVVSQIDKRFTLYIGNDASPDNPLPIITKYLKGQDYHYFNYKENLGGQNLAMQWERILENVTEDWFQVLGDDDMIAENFVEEFYNILHVLPHHINLIRVNNLYFNDELKTVREGLRYKKIATTNNLLRDKIYYKTASTLSENIFRKSAFDLVGFRYYPVAWHTDDMIILEISKFGDFYYSEKTSVKIYNGQLNLSSSNNNILEKFNASQEFLIDLLLNYNSYLESKLIQRYINNLYTIVNQNNFKFSIRLIYLLTVKGYIKLGCKLIKINILNK
ncbi:glycosyltransferase [Empedobacter falsenii]